ncbi:hypothetical protein [Mesorhizobium sp. CO1-1-8]|uniref:hypothetical protein n=1 Tax=Mesorhizobium sp. CO1-1-8 TaxID=2876631 RepID=UPI001CD07C7B|nr:hypothetical protein [Mesorhizobium sp. CO1-1-8]MBZ9772978.1 hypothetical protein [Mesorhizobium sp. CO1-1-8]
MIGFGDIFGIPLLTKERFLASKEDGIAHRICFGSTHANALTEYNERHPYKFSVPFPESIEEIFEFETGLKLFSSKFGKGVWCGLSDREMPIVRDFMDRRRDHVFLRDHLDSSLALSMHYNGNSRTPMGDLEYAAKYQRDASAIDKLADLAAQFISGAPRYKTVKLIAPVPPRPDKQFDLPTALCAGVSQKLGLQLVAAGEWTKPKAQLKEKSIGEKWDALDAAEFRTNQNIKGKGAIILMDDLYQSGCTINFVGNRVQHYGEIDVFGLSVVKSAGDQDNL